MRETHSVKTWALLLGVMLVSCAPFLRAIHFGFIAWDDDIGIEQNEAWRGLGGAQLRWMFTTFTLGHWQPLAWLSFGIEHVLWGINPQRMHAVNVALHGLNAALFFLLARRLIVRGERWLGPVVAALFFALHPLRTETVAWITERAHLLAIALLLGSVLAWMSAVDGSSRARIVSVVLFALSLMAKAWGIALPFALLVLDVYPLARRNEHESAVAFAGRMVREKLPFFVLAAAAIAVELAAKGTEGEFAPYDDHGAWSRVGQASSAVFFYLGKLIWPVRLSPLYEFRPAAVVPVLLPLLGVVGLTALFWLARRRLPALFAAWAVFVILLMPVSGIAQWGLQRFADRYTYLAALPLALLLGAAAAMVFERFDRPLARCAVLLLCATTLSALGFASAKQVEVWSDSQKLWRRVIELDRDSFVGWYNLSATLHRAGRLEEAAEAARMSVGAHAGVRNRRAWFHLGQLESLLGRRELAKWAWREALKLDPAEVSYLDWLASTQTSREARRTIWELARDADPDNEVVASRLAELR